MSTTNLTSTTKLKRHLIATHIFSALSKIGGLELESDYPYHGHKEHCDFSSEKVQVRIKGHVDLPKDEESMAKWLISKGPISIGNR